MKFVKWDENTIININSIDEIRWKEYGDGYEITMDTRHHECIMRKYFPTKQDMKAFIHNNFEVM